MNGTAGRFLQLSAISAGFVALAWVLTSQAARPVPRGIPLPTDWSHQHLIFTPAPNALANVLAEDPRYWQQAYRRAQGLRPFAGAAGSASSKISLAWPTARGRRPRRRHSLGGLWSEDLGTGGSPGAGNYPAKFSFNSSVASCSTDYVVFSTGLVGSGTQANIVAFNNLYSSGCTAPVPAVYWAYNTGGAGRVRTSPVISLDGSQVAFVQTNGAGAGTLVLLKWAASTGTIGSPAAPVLAGSALLYRTCTAPCMWKFALQNRSSVATDDQTSSVFYDYGADIGWVGDSGGLLHQFTGIFKGTPTELLPPSVWPLQVNSGSTAATSPVHDHVSGKIFIGDMGGYLYAVNTSTGAVVQSGRLDYGAGLVESPVVDSANGLVYVFSSSDGTTACAAAAPCAAVYQLSTGFGSGTTGTKVTAGNSSAGPHAMYLGAFDSTYYNSASPPTGNLYVCGQTGQNPTLYQIPITAGALPAASTAVALNAASSTAACSPVSDIPNPSSAGGSEERLFLSVASNGRPTGCAGAGAGCLISFVDTPWVASTSYVVGQEILSTTQHIETVITAGTSGATHPTWTTTAGSIRTDGATLKWMDQGILTAALLSGWAANHAYALHNRITDTNGNVEVITTAGTSGGTTPTWPTTAGATVTDGGATWTNAGALPVAGLHTAGGTTGIIVDNTVGSGTLPGASQVYFGTLANQLCTTSGGTGGCAMQASQAALK